MSISPERLRTMFGPESVALVGAADKSSFSQGAFRNLVAFGMGERTHLVNKRGVEVHGRPSVTSCQEIGEPVDLALLMVPQAATISAMEDAAAAGISNVVVLSSGYGEAGAAGRAAQEELVEAAERLDLLVLGPNMLGFANFAQSVAVTSIPVAPQNGAVALLSQSGASSAAMVDCAGLAGVDLSFLLTLGNEAMITAGHVLDYLVDDEATRAVALFIESIRDVDRFADAARRAAAAGKAIVALKAGSSELAARTAEAHTGALVGDDRVTDAVLRELGIIRVDSIEDMLVTAGAAASIGRLPRSGTAVVSISGGACDIMADRAEEVGLPLPAFAEETVGSIEAVMPTYGTVQNPLDVTGAALMDPTLFTTTITSAASDSNIGSVLVLFGLPSEERANYAMLKATYDAIGAGARSAPVPVVMVNQVQTPITTYTRELMREFQIPVLISGMVQAVVTMGHLTWWSRVVDGVANPVEVSLPVPDVGPERRGQWSEQQARELLASAGVGVVPAVVATSVDEAVDAATSWGTEVALKIVSPQILHKSDLGGVALGVRGDTAVRTAYDRVVAAASSVPGATIEGVLVSPMRTGGVELLVGVVRDAQWGPALVVGLGGIFVEVLGDSALATLPVTPEHVETMLRGLRGAPLLDGLRGSEPVDVAALSEQIALIGNLALALGEDLVSLEVNPLRADGALVEALDAVVEWRDGASPS